MTHGPLDLLSDRISNAHQRVQADHASINPVVGVNRQMRTQGIPADAITIDCLQSNRRLLIILHDQNPDIVRYQFGRRDQDPGATFEQLPFDQVTENQLYDWIVEHIRPDA